MSKRKSNGDNNSSSLDLLLDTMCNTFGGVMFIAISLIIITAMIPEPPKMEKSKITQEEYQKMQEKIEKLKKEVQAHDQNTIQTTIVDQKIIEEILKNKKIITTITEQIKTIKKSIQTDNIEVVKIKELSSKENAALASLKISSDKEKEQLVTIQGEIAIMSKQIQTMKQHKIVYKRLEEVIDNSFPYFYMIKNGVCYKIGFEFNGNSHPDVNIATNGVVTPNISRGFSLKNGLSNELIEDIKKLPRYRFPSFAVYPKDADKFFEISTKLKTLNISHPWIPMEENQPTILNTVENLKYEK